MALAKPGDVDSPPASVLHLAGRLSDNVFSFLGPATVALAERGTRQTVVLLDDSRRRHLLPRFHESVRLVLTRDRESPSDRLRALLDAYCETADATQPAAAHLHGMVCSLLGLYASNWRGIHVPAYFSPHGSRPFGPLKTLGSAVLWTLGPLATGRALRAVVSNRQDARALGKTARASVHVIENPVGDSFFHADAAQASSPQIVTAGSTPNPRGAAQFAQCAVLLSDEMPDLRFLWMGGADPESAARLKAAQVTRVELRDEASRATRLSASWIYFAPEGTPGLPVHLAEAMALGLPCVAWDIPHHRDLIEDDVTGFLCRDIYQVLERMTQLLRSEPLRARLGDAARAHARERFDGKRFRESVVQMYGGGPVPMAPSSAPPLRNAGMQPMNGSAVMAVRSAPAPSSPLLRTLVARTVLPLIAIGAGARLGRGIGERAYDPHLQIRPAAEADVALLRAHFEIASADWLDRMLPEQATGQATLAVAAKQSGLIGMAAIQWDGPRHADMRQAFPACPEIHSVEVHSAVRSHGVGARLLNFLESLALVRGCQFTGVTVTLDNVDAYAHYLQQGYVDFRGLARPDETQTSSPLVPNERFLIKALS